MAWSVCPTLGHWRRDKQLASETANDNRKCPIKGKLGEGSVSIFHMPSGMSHSRTKINESRSERWLPVFQSTNDASVSYKAAAS